MRGIPFNKFRESFRNLLADMPEEHCTKDMIESIIRTLPLTIGQKKALHADGEYMLNYRLRAISASMLAERIANGKGWRI